MHHLCRPTGIAASVPVVALRDGEKEEEREKKGGGKRGNLSLSLSVDGRDKRGPDARIDSGEEHDKRIEEERGEPRVSRAACVTSEAPGGISNHHNRVDSLMRPYVASNGRRAIDRRRRRRRGDERAQ